MDKVEQVVRLIRSKGVSVWFITQTPSDLPDSVLGQIGNRVQHALRAYTPNDQKALRAAARSFRANPAFDTEEALQALGVGEALVSVLDEKGTPTVVERAGILPPRSSMSAVEDEVIRQVAEDSPFCRVYSQTQDRRSAYEMLEEYREQEQELQRQEEERLAWEKERLAREKEWERRAAATRRTTTRKTTTRKTTTRKKKSAFEKAVDSAANTVGREVGKKLVRGLVGTLLK